MRIIKYIIAIILLGSAIKLSAQDNGSGKVLSGGIYFAPNISYRLLSNTDDYYSFISDGRNLYEKPAFYFSSGLNLDLDINNTYGFESGISYLQNGYAFKKTELINNSTFTHWSNNVKYSLLEIPLGFRYYICKQKLKVFTSLGVGIGLHLSNSIVYHYYIDNKLERNEIYRNILDVHALLFSVYWGLGIKYSLNENIDITTRLVVSQNISSVLNSDIGEYLTSGSLRLGISKNF